MPSHSASTKAAMLIWCSHRAASSPSHPRHLRRACVLLYSIRTGETYYPWPIRRFFFSEYDAPTEQSYNTPRRTRRQRQIILLHPRRYYFCVHDVLADRKCNQLRHASKRGNAILLKGQCSVHWNYEPYRSDYRQSENDVVKIA